MHTETHIRQHARVVKRHGREVGYHVIDRRSHQWSVETQTYVRRLEAQSPTPAPDHTDSGTRGPHRSTQDPVLDVARSALAGGAAVTVSLLWMALLVFGPYHLAVAASGGTFVDVLISLGGWFNDVAVKGAGNVSMAPVVRFVTFGLTFIMLTGALLKYGGRVIGLVYRQLRGNTSAQTATAISHDDDETTVAEDRSAQQELNRRWKKALETHDQLDARWHNYETSLEAILARPLLRDLTDPVVEKLVRAMSEARNLRESKAPKLKPGQSLAEGAEYLNAVSRYELAFNAAERKASTSAGESSFTEKERADLKSARRMLNLVLDGNASETERQGAYNQVIKILQGLTCLSVPKAALQQAAVESGLTANPLLEAA